MLNWNALYLKFANNSLKLINLVVISSLITNILRKGGHYYGGARNKISMAITIDIADMYPCEKVVKVSLLGTQFC
jgi:hypothetical protein